MKYWIVTKVFTGPAEWSEEEQRQEWPVAAFHEFEKFLEWYKNKQKQAEGFLPYNIYRLEWVEGKEDPKWTQFYEGCLNNLR